MNTKQIRRMLALGTFPLAVLIAACNPQDALHPSSAGDDENAKTTREVTGYDNNTYQLAALSNESSNTLRGDSTKETDTPPVAPEDILARCGYPGLWSQLVKCMENEVWYHEGFRTMSPYGERCKMYSWEDAKRYAAARLPDGQEIPALIVHVIGPDPRIDGKPVNAEIAKRVIGEMYNIPTDALTVVFHPDIVNSMGLENKKVTPFDDSKNQIRLALAPIMFDQGTGKPTSLCTEGGVFIDCLNIFGKWKGQEFRSTLPVRPSGTGTPPSGTTPSGTGTPPPGSSTTTPGSSTTTAPPTTTQPPSTTTAPPTTPPVTTTEPPSSTTNAPKTPGQGSGPSGNAGPGDGTNLTPTVGPVTPPDQMERPPASQPAPPPPPAPEPAPAPPRVTPAPSRTITIVPSAEPPNHGAVPTDQNDGCTNLKFC